MNRPLLLLPTGAGTARRLRCPRLWRPKRRSVSLPHPPGELPVNETSPPGSRPRRAGSIVRLAWTCVAIPLAMAPAAWNWSHRSAPQVSPDSSHTDWQSAPSRAQAQEPTAPGAALRGATGVPPAIARDEEPFVGRRNFVEQMQRNEYLAAPARPLQPSAAQAGGSPAPRRREAAVSREVSAKDCSCARLDPACACLPTAPACPVARAGSDEFCRYF